MKKVKTISNFDGPLDIVVYELISDEFVVTFSFVPVIPIEEICYLNRIQKYENLYNVDSWIVHRPDPDGEWCNYFGTCHWRDAIRYGDKQWIIDNLTPDPEEFDRRVWARMIALANSN